MKEFKLGLFMGAVFVLAHTILTAVYASSSPAPKQEEKTFTVLTETKVRAELDGNVVEVTLPKGCRFKVLATKEKDAQYAMRPVKEDEL